jgi:hypothetical protein
MIQLDKECDEHRSSLRANSTKCALRRVTVEEMTHLFAPATFKFDGRAYFLLGHSVSFTDQVRVQPTPRFRQTSRRKWGCLVAAIRQARPPETTANNNDREDGSRKPQPVDTARNFDAAEVSG